MNSNPENFDALRRLLTLKRYEQPPPGYFDTFSSKITARIRAGERGEPDSIRERLFGEAGWWQRVCVAMQSRPGFAGHLGLQFALFSFQESYTRRTRLRPECRLWCLVNRAEPSLPPQACPETR